MAKRPESPEAILAEIVELPDGRKIRIRAYDDGSIRFRIDRTPYVLTEAYLSGGSDKQAILSLSPGRRGDSAERHVVTAASDS